MNAAGRTPLSVTIITLNAGTQLDACLASVRFASEILVLDSGSTDDTERIARAHGARFERQSWLGYGRQKQRAVELATHDWILSIDADEHVSDVLRASIEAALTAPTVSAYAMARCNRFMGRWLRHGEAYPDWSTRLFRRGDARWSEDDVHERVLCDGRIARIAGDLMHDSAPTLESYLAKQDRYTTLAATAINASGTHVSIAQIVLSPIVRFLKFYVVRRGFMDGVPGLVHIVIGCWTSFLKYAKAWALQNGQRL